MTETETKAYNLVAALHTEAMLDNVRLQQRLDDVSSHWFKAFKYWIKRKLRTEKGYRV
jgi:hypothetical protein